ncbi:unnamed protein product [Schistosoma margrebowiei]|uniref:Store-operated calcium entry-associated regulatory factor n=1 Tax=Schistosoma margrebowiei TaxID=48269 RepID=A0AA85AI77_9TREM|nr:unnamed protein product [Schistosoma margrebowiei]
MTFTSKKLQGQVTRKSYHTSFPVSTMLFSLVFLSLCLCFGEARSNRILLRDVDVITLYHDKFAQSRKGYRLPQLKCVGGSGFKHPQYYPKVVQCYNRGFDGRDVQWECKAELDKSASFGAVNVNCEGYDYPEDEYIVYGSCALEYELNVRGSIREKINHRTFEKVYTHAQNNSGYFIIIGLIILAAIIWYFCIRPTFPCEYIPPTGFEFSQSQQRPPPPPYDEAIFDDHEDNSTRRRQAPSAPPEYGWTSNVMGSSQSRSRWNWNKSNDQSSSWLSNGLAAGAGFLGGYFMGSRSNTNPGSSFSGCSRTTPIYTEEESFIRSGNSFSDLHYSSSNTQFTHGRRSRTPSPETHISSGFGGTSRR